MKTKQLSRFKLHRKQYPNGKWCRQKLFRTRKNGNGYHDPTGAERLSLTFPGLISMPVPTHGTIATHANGTIVMPPNGTTHRLPVEPIVSVSKQRKLENITVRMWTMILTVLLTGAAYVFAGEYGPALVLMVCFASCILGAVGVYTEKPILMGFSDLNIAPYVVGLVATLSMPYFYDPVTGVSNSLARFGVICGLLLAVITPELMKASKPLPEKELRLLEQQHKKNKRIAKFCVKMGWEIPFPYELPQNNIRGQALVYAIVLTIALMLLGNLFFMN